MSKYMILICGLATITLSIYQLVAPESELMPYTQLIMGTMLLFLGIEEIRKYRKATGYLLIFTAIFIFIVAVYILLL